MHLLLCGRIWYENDDIMGYYNIASHTICMLCISWLIVNHEGLTIVSHEGLTLKCHEGHFRITSQQTWGQRYQRLRAHVDDCISIALFTLILFYDMRFIILSILIIHCGLWVLGLLWHIFIVSIDGDYIISSSICIVISIWIYCLVVSTWTIAHTHTVWCDRYTSEYSCRIVTAES